MCHISLNIHRVDQVVVKRQRVLSIPSTGPYTVQEVEFLDENGEVLAAVHAIGELDATVVVED